MDIAMLQETKIVLLVHKIVKQFHAVRVIVVCWVGCCLLVCWFVGLLLGLNLLRFIL